MSEPTFDETPIKELEFTDPCLGSVGSKPFLDDVQAQLRENFHAQRVGRLPVILPIQCRLCGSHHEANQLDAATAFPGVEFEQYAYERIVPKENQQTYVPQHLLDTVQETMSGTPGGVGGEVVIFDGTKPK